ncbi:hypothetical protein GC174_04885 [bacterium]|nr:hypothetical protein [bacterium]
MRTNRNLFLLTILTASVILLIFTPFLSACTNSGSSTKSGNNSSEKKKPALPVANPEYPGDYKVVEFDGKKFLQGRFPQGQFGGSLVRSLVGSDPKTFNAWAASDTTSSGIAGLMFASLMVTDMYNGEVKPYLAEAFSVDEDGVTYTTTLREGLTWSDGKPITSADVEFTWNTIVAGGYGNSSLRDVTAVDGVSPRVTSVDERTNKYVTAKKFAPFMRVLGAIPIAPKHVVEPIIRAKDGRKRFQGFWGATIEPKTLVVSGPFILERFIPSQRVELKRNDSFFMVDTRGKRLPYLDKLVYVFVPDVQANLLKFKGKEIDITQVRSRDTFELMKERASGDFSLHNLGQSLGSVFLMFNMNRRVDPKTKKPYVDPVKSAWFNDVNFRQAVNHILNRDAMVANYFKGLGYPAFTTISPVSPFFNNQLKGFEPDVDYAMELLKKSGFKKDAAGRLLDKEGHAVEFDLVTMSGGTFLPFIGETVREDLKKLGMKVNFQEINFNILMDKVHTSCDWDAGIYALSGGDPFEPNDGANVYRSNGRLHLFDQRQPDPDGKILVEDAREWEKRIDSIFSEGATTLDKNKRKELYDEFQKILYEQAPFVYLCDAMNIIGARNTIKNYQPTQLSQLVLGLHNIEEVWIESSKTKAKGNADENK